MTLSETSQNTQTTSVSCKDVMPRTGVELVTSHSTAPRSITVSSTGRSQVLQERARDTPRPLSNSVGHGKLAFYGEDTDGTIFWRPCKRSRRAELLPADEAVGTVQISGSSSSDFALQRRMYWATILGSAADLADCAERVRGFAAIRDDVSPSRRVLPSLQEGSIQVNMSAGGSCGDRKDPYPATRSSVGRKRRHTWDEVSSPVAKEELGDAQKVYE